MNDHCGRISELYLVLEFCLNGDLKTFLNVSETRIQAFIAQ